MQDYHDRTVAITGAANGIGQELARAYGRAGARLALADLDAERLDAVADRSRREGIDVLDEVVDVRSHDAVTAFADHVYERFGSVDLCFLNAGVITAGTIWTQPVADWEWLLDVNVMGVVHGITAFVPRMIEQDTVCHVVTTASIAGLLTVENAPAYVASKFAALSLTEVLDLQLQQAGAKVQAHAVCPGIVRTDLDNCLRHRAPGPFDPNESYYRSDDFTTRYAAVTQSVPRGMPVAEAVDVITHEIEKGTFYIFTHPQYVPAAVARLQNVAAGGRPVLVRR